MRKIVLAALPAILAVPAWTTAAGAAPVTLTCGQTITQTTLLANDLSGCTNNGIIVGADNITLDLGGHTVAGTSASGDKGGVVLVGRTGVRVTNGTVRLFDVGVVIEGGTANTVDLVNAIDNISFETGQLNRGGDGIAILSSTNNRILNNNAVNNGPYSGIGIYSEADNTGHPRATVGVSSGNIVDGNVVDGNISARTPNNVVNTDNIGIRLEPGNTGNFILNNRVNNSGLDGITLFVRSTFTVVRGNVVTANGFYRQSSRRGNGIGLQIGGANDNLIENNISTRNADNGISIRNGSLRNTVRNNTSYQNVLLPPASQNFGPTFDLLDNNVNCDANVWQANRYGSAFPACAGGNAG